MIRNILYIFFILSLCACVSEKQVASEYDILQKSDELKELTTDKSVRCVKDSYIDTIAVPLAKEDKNVSLNVSVNMTGTLSDVCAIASEITNNSWYVEDKESSVQHIKYAGRADDFANYIAMRYGYNFHYDENTSSFIFSYFNTRTFTLLAASGTLQHKSQISNESNDDSNGTGSNASLETVQDNMANIKVDIWGEAIKTVENLLSKDGSVSANTSAGTLTVTDNARSLRNIEKFIKEFNAKLSRQVALQVRVWQLTIDNNSEHGLNLNAMFDDGANFALSAGAPFEWSSLGGELATTITGGKLKDSQATLKALSTYGKTSLVTSGSGVTMNNQPLPVQNIVRDTYISSMSLSTTDYGQTSEIKPSEVTTGFAMTVTPHILDKRTLILQYNASLNSLDGMRDFTGDNVKVEMPKVSSRAFSQRVTMKMGQTLVLAGFEQETQSEIDKAGIVQLSSDGGYGRTLIIITISVEAVAGYEGEVND